MMGIFGAILPRFVLLVAWTNDQSFWANLFGAPIWFVAGFLFLPWTTLIYGLLAANGMSLLNWIFVLFAVGADLGTWGVGALAARKQTSSYMGN